MKRHLRRIPIAILAAACGLQLPPQIRAHVMAPQPSGKDWCATKTESQLRSIRADLGGVRLSFRAHPQRGNFLFTPTYPGYSPEVRAKIRAEYKARGYTHYPIGPVWERGYAPWPGHDFRQNPEAWVALLEELWRDDLIPMVWLLPDGPYNVHDAPGGPDNPVDMAKVERDLTPLFSRADMQRVSCIVIPGWEMTDKEWVGTVQKATDVLAWTARVFPRAYRYWHPSADNDGPCSSEENGEGCEGDAWRAMAPYIHGQFWQTGTPGGWFPKHVRDNAACDSGAKPADHKDCRPSRDPAKPEDRVATFLDSLRYEVMRLTTNHYQRGGVRGADGKVLDVIAGEYSVFFELNDGFDEAWGRSWGTLAMTVPGVRGFGDGGR